MNEWAIDKINESMIHLIKSKSAQLTITTMTTDEEREELANHYGAISKILLNATQRHIKSILKYWRVEYETIKILSTKFNIHRHSGDTLHHYV